MGTKLALITLLCVGTALARIEEWNWLNQVSPNRKIQDSAFRPGREYQFFYNGQLTTGIPGASKQHSANRIQALVTVAFKSQNNVILSLQNVRVGKMNRQIPNPRKIMPFDAFEDQQIDQNLKQKLETTVKFSYTDGMVRDVEFDGREEPWSANVKRGVLNLLQVNLKQQRRVDSREESTRTNSRRDSDRSAEQDLRQPTFYRVMEETLEGECETLYSVQQQPKDRRSSQPVLNVTKSINFEKCNRRPQVKYNFRFASDCPTCDPKFEEDEKFLKSSTIVQYNITGTKDSFLIESARTESQYVFTPFSEEANVIVTYINQTLVLVKTGPIERAHEPQNPIRSDSNMVFTLDWNVASEKFSMNGAHQADRRLLNQGAPSQLNKVEMAKKIYRQITSQMKEQVDEEVPRKFSEFVEWLRYCDQQELEQIVRMQESGQQSPEEERKAKNLIPQALGACGTKECVKQLTQKIQQGHIAPLRGALALKGLLHSRATSKEIINEVLNLAESEKARQSEPLKRTSWLTAGSLINALCAENEDQLAVEQREEGKKLCTREQKDNFVKILFNRLRQSNKWQDKVLLLKTIGNAGLDLSIFELEKIIRQQDSTQQPMYARLEAILALRELRDDMPKKIQRVLMPVAMNRREYPTIRSMASYMLLQTQPERPVLDQLARSLINEPSHQFAAFLYTQLESYANSTNPCEEKLATDAKLALRQAKKVSTSLGYSRLWHSTFHSDEKNIGLDLDVGAIYSNTSSIPRHVGATLHSRRFGYWQKYLATVSLFNEGLEPLIREFTTERGAQSWLSNSLMDILRRHPRNAHNSENEYERELDDIFSKHLKIRHRQYEQEYENEPKAYFTAMFKSQTVVVLPIGKELVQQALQQGASRIGEMAQKLQRGLSIDYATAVQLHEAELRMPTSLGLPLVVSTEMPMAISIKGKIQASYESPRKVKVQAELKPSAVATAKCQVEAWSPIVVSGVKVQSKAKVFAPIDARIEVELAPNPQIKANIKPPTQRRDILVLESRPVTYTQSWQQYLRNADQQHSSDELTVVGEELNRVKTFNKCAGRQTLGFDVCTRGQVHNTPAESPKGTPFSPLSGQNKIVVTAQPSESNQDIQIRINGKVQKVNGQDMHKPLFNNLGRQQPFQDDDDDSSSSSESSSEPTSSQESQQSSTERREQHRRTQEHKQRHPQQQQQQQGNRDRFQQYREYQVKKGYKTQVDVEFQAGPNSKANVELTHVYDAQRRYGKVNMKLHRQQPQQWQACFDAEMMFPENPQSIDEVRDKKIVSQAQLRWGQSCSSQNYIQLTAQAERSRQQTQYERQMSEYKQYNNKQRCQGNKGWCSPLTQEDLVEKIGHMLKYRVDIDYQNVPEGVKNATNGVYRALKHYYYWQTDVDQISARNQQNKIRAELVLDAQTKQRLNVTIKTPKESIMIQDIPLSRSLATLNQKQPFADQARNYWNREDEDEDQAQCSITGKTGWQRRSQVETFDGTKFSAPFTNCWVVLAKDCGSPKPEFVVMARKSEGASADLKEVKILTRQNRIELKPDNSEYGSVKVKVNGQQYDPESDQDVEAHGHVVAKIDKEGQSISVELPEAGAEVDFDGYAINVKLNQFYQGQQCGLCGHFDGEQADEFRNPDFTEEQDLRQFYMNYLIKDGRCQAPKQLNEVCESQECDQDKSSSSSSSSSSSDEDDGDSDETTEKPDHKTKVIEIDDKICFSTIPVPQCDDNSYATTIKEQKRVPYHCVDQDSSSAESFERKARFSKKHISSLANRQPNFTRTESIPEKCQKHKS